MSYEVVSPGKPRSSTSPHNPHSPRGFGPGSHSETVLSGSAVSTIRRCSIQLTNRSAVTTNILSVYGCKQGVLRKQKHQPGITRSAEAQNLSHLDFDSTYLPFTLLSPSEYRKIRSYKSRDHIWPGFETHNLHLCTPYIKSKSLLNLIGRIT